MTDTAERTALTRERLLGVYRMMRTIREFEERVHAEFATGDIPGFVHLYAGEEASAVGVCASGTCAPGPAGGACQDGGDCGNRRGSRYASRFSQHVGHSRSPGTVTSVGL